MNHLNFQGNQQHLELMQHTIGVGADATRQAYRNHFVTGEGSTDFPLCMDLVQHGLMARRSGNELSGGDDIFSLTGEGVSYLHLKRVAPPAPRLTTSQRRYRAYLKADGNMKFGEWLRRGCYKS